VTTVDTPRPTRPGIGNGARWSDIQATLDRVNAAINDLDEGDPDSAQVAADMRAAIETTTLRDNARITESYRQLSEQVNATTPARILAIDGPLSAAEAEAIRDLVNAQPGRITDMPQLDDATIAELRASIQRQLTGIVTPTTEAASADAAFAVRGAYEDRFLDDEPRPPLTYEQMHDLIRRLGPFDPPPEPIQLTDEQFDQVPKAPPRKPWEPAPSPFSGIPVYRVDTVEESTAYRLERQRHIWEQHVELCGCTWDHPANVQPKRPGRLRRLIRRLFR
jgi:hypothetical protein